MLKYDVLARQITREAVQEIVERDGIKSRHADIDALKNVALIARRIVATQALCGFCQTVRIQIEQCNLRGRRREPASIEKVTSSHTDIQMLIRDMLVVEIQEHTRGTLPDNRIGKPQDRQVI